MKIEIQNVTEIKHFQRDLPLRIICDASKDGLGAVLQQQSELGWQPICFASRFLAEFEQKYSINELELLAVIWAVENFRNYVYGTEFEIVSDHRALLSVLKNNRGNKTFSSRLTRWVDRLLPFQFKIVHAPGRTMGMADYLSRHPSPSQLPNKFAEELWNDWFTVNVIDNISAVGWHRDKGPPPPPPPITEQQATDRVNAKRRNDQACRTSANDSSTPPSSSPRQCKQTIRQIASILHSSEYSSKLVSKMLSQSSLANSSVESTNSLLPVCFSDNQINVIQALGKTALAAAYHDDKILQKFILFLKKPVSSQIAKLQIPWRVKFKSFSSDSRDYVYMDERLVIPYGLRHINSSSLHYGHPGRDAMLSTASNIWWQRLHRENVSLDRSCIDCTTSGKNIKPLMHKKQFSSISTSTAPNDEIALDFNGSFSVGTHGKRYLLVSIDNFSGWPDVNLLREPKTSHVLDFLRIYIALHGIPACIGTDPGTVFQSRRFKEFCSARLNRHITCPVSDHRGMEGGALHSHDK